MYTRVGGTAAKRSGVAMRDVAHAVVVGLMMRADFKEKDGSAGRRRSSSREAIVSRVGVQAQLLKFGLGLEQMSARCVMSPRN